jgi:hypothetical protein
VKLGLSHQGKKHRLRMFETRVLKRIFVLKREEVAREDCIMGSLIICTFHQTLLRLSSQGGCNRQDM